MRSKAVPPEIEAKLFGYRAVPGRNNVSVMTAEIRHQLVIAGQPIGEMDTMIAAHSLAAGAVLVTNNTRHYDRIPAPMMLQNWSGDRPA